MSLKSSTIAIPENVDVPRHVAVIMDGNGRWARNRGLPRVAGHRQGVHSVRAVVKACGELGICSLFRVKTGDDPKRKWAC